MASTMAEVCGSTGCSEPDAVAKDALRETEILLSYQPHSNMKDILRVAETLPSHQPDANIEDVSGMAQTLLSHANVPTSERLVEYVDEAVRTLIPSRSEILAIDAHGLSSWSRAACIETTLDGEPIEYFIKVTASSSGKVMFQGNFESMKAIHMTLPDFCPEPIGWGNYASEPDVYFFLSRFVHFIDEPPDSRLLPAKLAEMHKRGVAEDGKYGFHVPFTGGFLALDVTKRDSWEEFFVRYMQHMFRMEQIAHGPPADPAEYQRLVRLLFDRLIPRLLRPLETGGRDIVPSLLHTDLWDGNTATSPDGKPIIFDANALYGHNEFDLGVWSCPRVAFGSPFIDQYHEYIERSHPQEDHDGRNQLYLMAFEARASVSVLGSEHFRNEMLRHLTELDEKYPESYEEWARARGENVCPPKVPYI